eukprot:365188-Chlamydomonas_euryale.AAC.15
MQRTARPPQPTRVARPQPHATAGVGRSKQLAATAKCQRGDAAACVPLQQRHTCGCHDVPHAHRVVHTAAREQR